MTADPRDWIAVAALPHLGPASYKRLWENGWTPETLLNASEADWQRLGLKRETITALKQLQWGSSPIVEPLISKALTWSESCDLNHIIPITHSDYPALLKEIHDPPPLLFVRGNLAAIGLPQLAIVGSRKASSSGIRIAYEFASYLSQRGLTINSGLALGIDAAAHQAAVNVKLPTVAVLGTGADKIYPARNRSLGSEIIRQGGAWVSEFFPETPPLASHFPRRNRIISGMSVGVLVVEAAPKSGSLITARVAIEQGREVFAIPGGLNNPMSRGCNQLIKSGASLVESADDIVSELGALLGVMAPEPKQPIGRSGDLVLSELERHLLDQMGYDPISVDTLCERTGSDIAVLSVSLVELELKGVIEQSFGGYIRC